MIFIRANNPHREYSTRKYWTSATLLEKSGLVTIKVYDILGKLVATLVNEQQNSGLHTINFNAAKFTSGVYIYQINSGSFTSTKKMILVK